MAFQTKEQFQDKASNKLDRVLHKKAKQKPLMEETFADLGRRGASLAEQFEWIRLDKIRKERQSNG